MVNEINNGLIPPLAQSTTKKSGRMDSSGADSQASTDVTTEAAGDNLELSVQAQLLNQLEAKIADLPEVNQDRVDALRDAINSGQYDIDSFSLAQDIINFELK